jgi:uncharacterized Zn-binding protein involved in type VI secretion
MPAVQRMDDLNDGGGKIDLIPQGFVRVDGKVAAVVGSKGTAHPPCPEVNAHCAHVWTTTVGAPRVRIGGLPVIRAQDPDSCTPHRRVGGSSTTRVGNGGGPPGGPNDWDSGEWEEAEWQ